MNFRRASDLFGGRGEHAFLFQWVFANSSKWNLVRRRLLGYPFSSLSEPFAFLFDLSLFEDLDH